MSSESYSKKTTFKASDTRQIGKIINDRVERGSYDEAVVGIKIQPIHTLVKLRYLHLALRRALLDYVDEQGDTTCKLSTDADNSWYLIVYSCLYASQVCDKFIVATFGAKNGGTWLLCFNGRRPTCNSEVVA